MVRIHDARNGGSQQEVVWSDQSTIKRRFMSFKSQFVPSNFIIILILEDFFHSDATIQNNFLVLEILSDGVNYINSFPHLRGNTFLHNFLDVCQSIIII